MRKPSKKRQLALDAGFASGFEYDIALALNEIGAVYSYEVRNYGWREHMPGVVCDECGSKKCSKGRKYTPDFFLPNGVTIEAKGKFTPHDRKIAEGMKVWQPDLKMHYLFQRDNKITPRSKTRYSTWCHERELTYAVVQGGSLHQILKAWVA